jgi:hexosaminidase
LVFALLYFFFFSTFQLLYTVMKILFSISIFTSIALAIWPIPKSYEHGDTVLWIAKNVTFYWYEAGTGANNVEYHSDQAPFVFAAKSNSGSHIQGNEKGSLSFHKRYTEPSDDYESTSEEGVSGDDIIDYAIRSAWKTIKKQSFYPWKFHPRSWDEPTPDKTNYIDRVNIQLLASDPSHVAKVPAGDVDESRSMASQQWLQIVA